MDMRLEIFLNIEIYTQGIALALIPFIQNKHETLPFLYRDIDTYVSTSFNKFIQNGHFYLKRCHEM